MSKIKTSIIVTAFFLLFLPLITHGQATLSTTPCTDGYIRGTIPALSIPDYDYTNDGYLQFHFRLIDSRWKYNFGILKFNNSTCGDGGADMQFDRVGSVWPGVSHLILRFVEDATTTNVFSIKAFNGDTNEPVPLDPTSIMGILGSKHSFVNLPQGYVRILLGNTNSSDLGNENVGDIVSTASLPYKTKPFKNPVLIIPGILGVDLKKYTEKLWLDIGRNAEDVGDEFMDPLQFTANLNSLDENIKTGELLGSVLKKNYYNLIVDEFKRIGYVLGQNLFTFPYDWRYGVGGTMSDGQTNVDILQQKIQDVMMQASSTKVDIVAHSTGGLLLKKYVASNLANHSVGKAVFVGVPNAGAPKALKVLLSGENFGIPWLADSEMRKISTNLPVAYELLPSEQYYKNAGSYLRTIDQKGLNSTSTDLDFVQSNSFLINEHKLNSDAMNKGKILHTLDFDNFDMRTVGVDLYSISGCKAGTIGKIIERRTSDPSGSSTITYDSPKQVPGDGTVPLESAASLTMSQDRKFFALKASHAEMPSQEGIRQAIANIVSTGKSASSSLMTQDISKCKLKGKTVSIYSPLNIRITDNSGNIAGLNEDGLSIENNIPNADYSIMGDHKFVYLPEDEGQTYNITVNGTDTGTFTLQTQSIDNNETLKTEIFANLPVTTALSGQVILSQSTTTLSLDSDGDGVVDKIVRPTSVIYPDKVSPEVAIQFDSNTKDLKFIPSDNISGADKIKVVVNGGHVTITDEANNNLDIAFGQTSRRKAMKADIQSLTYNDQIISLNTNSFSFSWRKDVNGLLKSLTQVVKSRNDFSVKATYDGVKTTLTGTDQNGKFNKTLNGIILLKVATNKGDLNWSY